jgi:hypothetical protein
VTRLRVIATAQDPATVRCAGVVEPQGKRCPAGPGFHVEFSFLRKSGGSVTAVRRQIVIKE